MNRFDFDVFISHASDDKDEVARPLAKALTEGGCKVWFDEMALKIGDSLVRKIDEGLSKSRYGVVILSPNFLKKQWPQYELDGLVSREMADAVKVILPVWHQVEARDIRRYSFPLSMRLAGTTGNGIEKLAIELLDVIRPGQEEIESPEVNDELSLCKEAILTGAIRDKSRILLMPASLSGGKCVTFNRYAFNDTERQRKLFLYALDELESAGLVEQLSEQYYELTYPGIQAAERMSFVERPQDLGKDRSEKSDSNNQ